ncbi:hypothetical protein [Spiroplasma kunkelii]|nr:hypothetical protein [Spiroplasma kunkelii]
MRKIDCFKHKEQVNKISKKLQELGFRYKNILDMLCDISRNII